MWWTNAEQLNVWKKLKDGSFTYSHTIKIKGGKE